MPIASYLVTYAILTSFASRAAPQNGYGFEIANGDLRVTHYRLLLSGMDLRVERAASREYKIPVSLRNATIVRAWSSPYSHYALLWSNQPDALLLIDLGRNRIVRTFEGMGYRDHLFVESQPLVALRLTQSGGDDVAWLVDMLSGVANRLPAAFDGGLSNPRGGFALFHSKEASRIAEFYDAKGVHQESGSVDPDFSEAASHIVKSDTLPRFAVLIGDRRQILFKFNDKPIDIANGRYVFRNTQTLNGDTLTVFYNFVGDGYGLEVAGVRPREFIALEGSPQAVVGCSESGANPHLYIWRAGFDGLERYRLRGDLPEAHVFCWPDPDTGQRRGYSRSDG
jgi:hypothetical protein